jgi:hypothetical protein
VVVVGCVVVVVGCVVVVVGSDVVVVVGGVVVVVGAVVVVDVGGVEIFAAGVRATVPATGKLPPTVGLHDPVALGPSLAPCRTALATWESPKLLTVASSWVPAGAWATSLHASLPSLNTKAEPDMAVVTLGEVSPGRAAEAFTGSELLTPENATVTIETCVAGLTRSTGLAWPTVATVTQAASRAPDPFATSKVSVHPESQLIDVNE